MIGCMSLDKDSHEHQLRTATIFNKYAWSNIIDDDDGGFHNGGGADTDVGAAAAAVAVDNDGDAGDNKAPLSAPSKLQRAYNQDSSSDDDDVKLIKTVEYIDIPNDEPVQQRVAKLVDIGDETALESAITCMICLGTMVDATSCMDGHTYSFKCIEAWMKSPESRGASLTRIRFLSFIIIF